MTKKPFLFSCVFAFTAAAPITVSAQWKDASSVDAFTDEEIVMIVNNGKVLSGETGSTSLVYRIKDQEHELFWSTPDNYICDFDKTVKVRFGDSEPRTWYVNSSKGNSSLFSQTPMADLWNLIDSGGAKFLLEDGCGSRIVAEFEGSPRGLLPRLEKLKSTGWDMQTGGLIAYKTNHSTFSYRPWGTNVDFVGSKLVLSKASIPHDFRVDIDDAETVASLKKAKGKLVVGELSIPVKVYKNDKNTSAAQITLANKSDGLKLFDALKMNSSIKISVSDLSIVLDVANFEDALVAFSNSL